MKMMDIKMTSERHVECVVTGDDWQVLVNVCELTRRRLTQALDMDYNQDEIDLMYAFIRSIFDAAEVHGSHHVPRT